MPSGDDTRHAILSLDPGETTGVAACYLRPKSTLKETLLEAYEKKAVEVGAFRDKDGMYKPEWANTTAIEPWLLQSRRLHRIIRTFYGKALIEEGIRADQIHIVWEDFILRRRKEGGATGNLTSIWVMAGAIARYEEGQVTMTPMTYQQPSEAKGFATNARLKLWGLYEPGSEHTKDAWRHLALFVNKHLLS